MEIVELVPIRNHVPALSLLDCKRQEDYETERTSKNRLGERVPCTYLFYAVNLRLLSTPSVRGNNERVVPGFSSIQRGGELHFHVTESECPYCMSLYIYIYSAWQEIAPCNCSQGLEDPTPDEGAPSFVTTASGRPVHFNGQHPAALASIQNMKTNSSMPEG